MSRTAVPVHITPHLVPFFFKEFKGVTAMYLNKQVKAAKISTQKPLGAVIRMMMIQVPKPEPVDKFHLYLSIQERERSKKYFGQVYKCSSGVNSFLKLPEQGAKLVNDYLEDVFRVCLVSFVEGHLSKMDAGVVAKDPRAKIREAVDLFLLKYDLYEEGYGIESLRRYYYRVLEDGEFLKRMQTHW